MNSKLSLFAQQMLLDSPAQPDQELGRQAAEVPALSVPASAQRDSQADSGSPAESATSQAGTAQCSGDSTTPSRAAPTAQAASALHCSPAQTPLGSLHRLAHMLHTPQDMAAARMHRVRGS